MNEDRPHGQGGLFSQNGQAQLAWIKTRLMASLAPDLGLLVLITLRVEGSGMVNPKKIYLQKECFSLRLRAELA